MDESEWDADERAWMLALGEYRDGLCRTCGGTLDETTDALNEDRYHRLDPVRCYRCLEYARADAAYKEDQYPLTLIHRVELRRRRGVTSDVIRS